MIRGASAPGFDLTRIRAGQPEAKLSLAGLSGRVVLVNFWATWCKPCINEMPAMERLYQSLASEPFELVAVSIDEDAADVVEFAERFELTFPIVHDTDHSVYEAYQTMGVPESLLINSKGEIVERYVGPREWDAQAYRARILDLIQESAIPKPPAAPSQ